MTGAAFELECLIVGSGPFNLPFTVIVNIQLGGGFISQAF